MENNQFPSQEDMLPEEQHFPAKPDTEYDLPLTCEEEAIPPEDVQAMLDHPEVGEEITADEHAMAWHGMTHPSDPEPSFDPSTPEEPDETDPEQYGESLNDAAMILEQEAPEEQDYTDNEGFQEEFSTKPIPEAPIPSHERPARKGRPKRRRGEILFGLPQIAITAVWLAIILVIGVTLGRMVWICAADVLAFGRVSKEVTITIYESDTIDDITEKLHKNGLIRYPGLFKLYASLAVDEGEIHPGIWDLNTIYDYHALVNMMSPSSNRKVVELMIPEGYTCRQIFALLEENKVCTAQDIGTYAAQGELDEYWFLENVERGDKYCLEGFLFPDTYEFYQNDNPRNVLEKMLDNFNNRFTEDMRLQLDTLNANVTNGTFSIHDVVIVASMIEKETASNEESPRIASVIYNRLFRWGDTPAYLNIDASIVYMLDGKTELTTEDLRIDNPYNTYLYTGLTPGAISNPGLASLRSALNPESTNYYFYVLNPAVGAHHFSSTYEEHEAFRATLE